MATSDPALIRLVTARYYEMQGLTTIADATIPFCWGASMMIGVYGSEMTDSLWPLLVVVIPIGLWMWAKRTGIRRRIEAFYAERCGRVAGFVTLTYMSDFFSLAVIIPPALVQLGAPPWVCIVTVLPLLVVQPLWTVVRDSPYRLHWLLPAIVGFVAALRLIDVRSFDQAFKWQLWVGVAGGLATACAGVLDHRLLLQTLHGGGDTADSTEQVPL
jgi:hypothetical protein